MKKQTRAGYIPADKKRDHAQQQAYTAYTGHKPKHFIGSILEIIKRKVKP